MELILAFNGCRLRPAAFFYVSVPFIANFRKGCRYQPVNKIQQAEQQISSRLEAEQKALETELAELNIQKKAISDSRIQVTFNQKYQSNTYGDQVAKTLDLHWKKNGWAILKEISRAIKY